MASINEIRQAEIEYCRDNLEYFIDNYGHIEDKDNPTNIIQQFQMWEKQREALRSIAENKFNVILKARQLGFSWLVLHYATWVMICPGRTVIGLSQKEDDAKELVRRMEVICANAPDIFREEGKQPVGWNGITYTRLAMELRFKFPDGMESKFTGMPSSPGSGRSFTANLIIFDEWAFQPFAEEIWKSGFPTINRPTGGQVIGLSTIERGSFFEEVFTNRDNGFNKIFIPWYADPRRDEKWYEDTKKAMGDAITQEYPATIEEALTVPGGSYFPEVNERNTVSKEPLKGSLIRYCSLDYGLDMLSVHWYQINSAGETQVYREYDKPNLTIGEAADVILRLSADEEVLLYLAPPDLWNRSQESGKSRAQLFADNGLTLTKVSNDFPAGCANMKEYLRPRENQKSRLTILDGCAPNLLKCLQKIQKDKKRPNVYAKEPHDLTHDVDSLRYFCVYWTAIADAISNSNKKTWTSDMWEDYENADEQGKQYLVQKYGEPKT